MDETPDQCHRLDKCGSAQKIVFLEPRALPHTDLPRPSRSQDVSGNIAEMNPPLVGFDMSPSTPTLKRTSRSCGNDAGTGHTSSTVLTSCPSPVCLNCFPRPLRPKSLLAPPSMRRARCLSSQNLRRLDHRTRIHARAFSRSRMDGLHADVA